MSNNSEVQPLCLNINFSSKKSSFNNFSSPESKDSEKIENNDNLKPNSKKRKTEEEGKGTSPKHSKVETQKNYKNDENHSNYNEDRPSYNSDTMEYSKVNHNNLKEATSLLFSDNLEIPSMANPSVTRVIEKVFSDESFKTLDIAYQIKSNLEKLNHISMTMVQQLCIPHILNDKDVLIKSQTGSGKTLAYVVPIIHKLMSRVKKIERTDGIFALIIVPTRELAIQTYDWFENLCKSCVWVVPGYLIGGEKKKSEKKRLKKGVNILVATPGRLIDHIHHTKSLSLKNIEFFVIDEADRLLEMGYEQNINSIVESMNEHSNESTKTRQTILLSATLTPEVQKLAGINMNTPITIDVSVGTETEGSSALTSDVLVTPENLTQYYTIIPAKLRLVTLAAFIISKCSTGNQRKMLIFMSTQDMVDFHTNIFKHFLTCYGKENTPTVSSLTKRAKRVLAGKEDTGSNEESHSENEDENHNDKPIIQFLRLHGNMSQQDRSSVFNIFRKANSGVLLCTDVAARGLDLPEVHWIVQYNPACTIADYVHRVGRTARVNNKGSALSFMAPTEVDYISMLHEYRIDIKEKKMESILQGFLKDQVIVNKRNKHQQAIEAATTLQMKIEKLLLSDPEIHDQAKKGYISFVRSYASYPKDVRQLFNFKALHLGHYAKSFGLAETPKTLGASLAFKAKRDMKEMREKRDKRRQVKVMKQKSGLAPKYAAMSEFDSGLG